MIGFHGRLVDELLVCDAPLPLNIPALFLCMHCMQALSSVTEAVYPTFAGNTPMLSYASTSAALTKASYPDLWRVVPNGTWSLLWLSRCFGSVPMRC